MTVGAVSVRALGDEPAMITRLAEVLLDCVAGGASVSFMLPLSRPKAEAFWQRIMASAARGERVVLVAEAEGIVLGTVQLVTDLPENQPHRGDVAKMLVHREARRRGVGEALLRGVEATARAHGRTLLVLDTMTHGDAERLYARHGWQRVGVIPGYAQFPDGRYGSTTYFYKDLTSAP